MNHRIDSNECLYGGAFWHGCSDLCGYIVVVYADDSLHGSPLISVNEVMPSEHVGSGNGYGTKLAEGQHGQPPLVMALENEHHPIIVPDSERLIVGCNLVGLFLQSLECEAYLLSSFAGPQQG